MGRLILIAVITLLIVAGCQTTTPATVPTQTATVMPTQTPESEVFTRAPINPRTPEEVVAAFYFYLSEEKYWEAIKLIEGKEILINRGELTAEQARMRLSSMVKPGNINNVVIKNTGYTPNGDRVVIDFTINYHDGQSKELTLYLAKENGKWKIDKTFF